jgi:hypothetical protein
VGLYSALDSLIRNAVYLVVVIRAMNLLEEQATYWIVNTFYWNWMLLPALPLADVLKQDVADTSQEKLPHWRKTSAYILFSVGIFSLWAVTFPAWEPFVDSVLQAANPDLVVELALQLAPCYAAFVLGCLMNAVFYAQGRTEFLVLGSFVVNLLLVALFLLMVHGQLPNTVQVVAAIFGIGLVAGALVTSCIYATVIRRDPLL